MSSSQLAQRHTRLSYPLHAILQEILQLDKAAVPPWLDFAFDGSLQSVCRDSFRI